MPEVFDPYLRWLGIRDPGRPPNHYRLLGLDLFENDSDVIAVAADRQMAHVRTFQTGQFAALSQRILNELAAARICLLKPEKKAVYDALLKKQLGSAVVAVRAKPQSEAAALPVATHAIAGASDGANDKTGAQGGDAVAEDSFDFVSSLAPTATAGRKTAVSKSAVPARKPKSLAPWIGLAIAGVLLVVGVIAVQQMGGSPEVATTDGSKNPVPAATSTTARPSSVPPRAGAEKKPAPAVARQAHRPDPATGPADHSNAVDPTDIQPASSQPLPKSSSPPEPPVHSPSDVIRVENPVQPDPGPANPVKPAVVAEGSTEVAQADTGKPSAPGESKADAHEHETKSTPKNSASASDRATDSKPKRAPVPSKEQITAAEAKVQKLFNVAAAKKPDERAALAKTLYAQGIDPNNQEVDRYVLLRMAMKDAVVLGDVDLSVQASNKLADTFDINAFEEKTSLLAALTKTVRTPAAAESLVRTAETLLNDSLDADQFDSAKEVAQVAAGAAAKAGNISQAKEFRQRTSDIDRIKKEFAVASAARGSLNSKPDDPDANYAWGYYLGPVKGDFDKALPFLAKSSNDSFQSLAKKELTKPTDASAQAELADAWNLLAEKSKPSEKVNIQSHAASLYKLALPALKGIARTAVEQKLTQIDADTKRLSSRNRMDSIVRVLTTGPWLIQWKAGSQRKATYFEDRTFSSAEGNGTWALDSGVVQCRWKTHPSWLQTIRVVDDHLEIEAYVDGVRNNTGTARLASP